MKKRARPKPKARTPAKRPPAKKPLAPSKPAPGKGGHWLTHEDFATLQTQLTEAQETLNAIRSGEVDAVVVNGTHGNQVYSLAGAEQPYRIYVERMQEGAATVSRDGVVLYCNQRYADMLRQPLERVMGANIVPALGATAWRRLGAVFENGRDVVKHEATLQRSGNDGLVVHITASLLPLEGQEVMCLVVTDLTDQKTQQELRLAKDVAEKANLAKDAFLAALSHELRTPLTPVLMAAVALEQNATLPDPVRRDLAMIRRNIELEARLIDDLLDLTRIAKGKLELHVAPMDVHLILKRAVEICRSDITAKRQKLSLHLDAKDFKTSGDSVRLQQALWNLIRNAIKFTSEGGEIMLHTANTPSGGIRLDVRDTGVGFDADLAPKLFRPFEQGGREVTRQFGGLGLGLAISSSIVEAHGGSIVAASPGRGQGATFTVVLPLREMLTVRAAAPAAPPPARATRGLNILLVEDHKDTRRTLQLHLEAARHRVHPAGTAEEALDLAARHPFDLVISDLGLPDEGGGLALMRELRTRHRLSGIAVSGYGMEEDVAHSRDAGFSHHLTKPINLDQLKRVIDEFASPAS